MENVSEVVQAFDWVACGKTLCKDTLAVAAPSSACIVRLQQHVHMTHTAVQSFTSP